MEVGERSEGEERKGVREREGEREREREGDSPLSLYATVLSRVVLSSVSRHRAGVRATVPAVQVRGECSYGT